ncbi:MAG: lysylphosphatidylglycerol synthase domain-containing protein [Gemmatimonadaceae bacterium]
MKSSDVRLPTRDAGSRWFVVLLRVALAIGALWALRRELHDVHADALVAQVQAYGWSHVALAVICATGSFVVLGVVELLAVRHADTAAKTRVSVRAALGTGFVANAVSQSVGVALLTGAAVRVRAYARYGMDAVAVAQVTAFVTLTATIGLLAAGAAALLATSVPVVIGTTTIAVRPWGVLLGCIVMAYLAWSVVGKRDFIGRGRWRLARPSPAMAGSQILLSVLDWLLAGMVLYAFMPASAGLGVAAVLSAYVIAQTVAVTSHIPAGAGVFEVAVLSLITRAAPAVDRSAVVAALVMFRVVYYLAPLLIATVVAGVVELSRARGRRAQSGDASYAEVRAQRAS